MLLRTRVQHRRFALLGLSLAILAFVSIVLVPAESEAIPCGFEYRYYSSATYTVKVGAAGNRPQSCGCTTYQWGQVTVYRLNGPSICLD
jgi:membrane protein YqaA with SNARE-associated domain